MALNRNESVFVSSAGDVLVCRSRDVWVSPGQSSLRGTANNPQADQLCKEWVDCQKELAVVCCEVDDLSLTAAQDSSGCFCGQWPTSSSNTTTVVGSKRPSPTGNNHRRRSEQEGAVLVGGGSTVHPPQHHSAAAPHYLPPHHHHHPVGARDRAQLAFQSDPIHSGFDDDESLVPIKSFDYSQFSVSEDNMASPILPQHKPHATLGSWDDAGREEKKSEHDLPEAHNPATPVPPTLVHGVPTFLSELSQVKVTQVSAHPLGGHVLVISDTGLLWAYGRNEYGQLGLGKTTSLSSPQRGHVMSPRIVTPLIENGGKAIACAAGVNHSIVAVMTEERRLVRSQTSPSHLTSSSGYGYRHHGAAATTESIVHHQLYGFGRNDFMKIGLVSPKMGKAAHGAVELESVTLPRRVALRCRVPPSHATAASDRPPQPEHEEAFPPAGIFCVAASEDHSAALVHRSSGNVELYTWGNAMHGALGLPEQPIGAMDHPHDYHHYPSDNSPEGGGAPLSTIISAVRVVPVPSFVASLSRSSNPDAKASSLLQSHLGECPISLSLGRRCTFVTTNLGRAFSFGFSEEGMLGLGEGITESAQPVELSCLPDAERFASVSAGAGHTVALSTTGNVYTWGTLPRTAVVPSKEDGFTRKPPPPAAPLDGNPGSRATATVDSAASAGICWNPVKEEIPLPVLRRMGCDTNAAIVSAFAGYDSSAYVVESGHVVSCGKASGRLGLGEIGRSGHHDDDDKDDVTVPRPLFGGLRLWNQRPTISSSNNNNNMSSNKTQKIHRRPNPTVDHRKPPPGVPRPVPLVRGSTFG